MQIPVQSLLRTMTVIWYGSADPAMRMSNGYDVAVGNIRIELDQQQPKSAEKEKEKNETEKYK